MPAPSWAGWQPPRSAAPTCSSRAAPSTRDRMVAAPSRSSPASGPEPMPEFDLAIRGGTLVTAADTFAGDLGIRNGRIAAVSERIKDAARTIDASGLLVLPG